MQRYHDVGLDIPLAQMDSRGHSSQSGSQMTFIGNGEPSRTDEKKAHFGDHNAGRRKRADSDPNRRKTDKGTLTGIGKVYDKIANFSIVTRYMLYVLPVSALIAIPIVIGATAAPNAKLGGVRIVWIFSWVEIVWNSLWISKLFAKALPSIFQFVCGVVSSGTRKYALIIRALEIPLSLVGWSLCSWLTLVPLMTKNPDQRAANDTSVRTWTGRLNQVMAAAFVATLIFTCEKLIIQLISINYHRKQFNSKIKESKHTVWLLGILYEASCRLFPAYGAEFADEDYLINDSIALGSAKVSLHKRSGSATPMKLIRDVGRVGDKITSAFGNIAHEITGKQVFNPTSAHSIVVEALEKKTSSEALARRIWMSFVSEGRDEMVQQDVMEVLGRDKMAEAEECFDMLDKDCNGDVSLDEMIMTVVECGRTRHSIANSMHDVDQAIHVLDNVLAMVTFIIIVFVFIAFLNASFVTTLATAGTALLSLSFVFAVTAQELLGSCIFLFIKHPYDVGDRVDISCQRLVVEHISLLFTVFKCVDNGKMVQVPNIVLNSNWIENVTRSKAMRETILMYINFDTSMDDILLLKQLLQDFVREKDNSRDFQPDLDVEVNGIAEMNKLELKVEIRHKSNWSNETLRATRRSKFMCALVQAIRKVPIYGPGGGDVPLGDISKPSFTVAISNDEAVGNRSKWAAEKSGKRLVPADPKGKSEVSVAGNESSASLGQADQSAADALNTKTDGAMYDKGRDDWEDIRDQTGGLSLTASRERRRSIDETRNILRRESTRGRRRRDEGSSMMSGTAESDALTSVTSQNSFPRRMESLDGRDASSSSMPGNGLGKIYSGSSVPPNIPPNTYAPPPQPSYAQHPTGSPIYEEPNPLATTNIGSDTYDFPRPANTPPPHRRPVPGRNPGAGPGQQQHYSRQA